MREPKPVQRYAASLEEILPLLMEKKFPADAEKRMIEEAGYIASKNGGWLLFLDLIPLVGAAKAETLAKLVPTFR